MKADRRCPRKEGAGHDPVRSQIKENMPSVSEQRSLVTLRRECQKNRMGINLFSRTLSTSRQQRNGEGYNP